MAKPHSRGDVCKPDQNISRARADTTPNVRRVISFTSNMLPLGVAIEAAYYNS